MSTFHYERIFYERKANSTTDWFPSDGTFTLTKRALIFIQTSWSSAPIKGLAVSTSNGAIGGATILAETNLNTSLQSVTIRDAGTHYVWMKLGNTGNGSPVAVYKICDLE